MPTKKRSRVRTHGQHLSRWACPPRCSRWCTPRCRPCQRRPKVDPVAPPSVAPHVPASVGRSHRSHGTGGQCCVTRRGQLCLPLTPPNRRSRSTVKLTTRVRPSHLRDLVTGTPRAATDSPGLYRGYPLVEHHSPSFTDRPLSISGPFRAT